MGDSDDEYDRRRRDKFRRERSDYDRSRERDDRRRDDWSDRCARLTGDLERIGLKKVFQGLTMRASPRKNVLFFGPQYL